jgi:hypothetical protein
MNAYCFAASVGWVERSETHHWFRSAQPALRLLMGPNDPSANFIEVTRFFSRKLSSQWGGFAPPRPSESFDSPDGRFGI